MANRLKTSILLIVLVLGAFGGAPLSAADTANGAANCRMKCCKKNVKAQIPHSGSKSFCRAMACSESMPSAPGSNVSSSSAAGFIADKTVVDFGFEFVSEKRITDNRLIRRPPPDTVSAPVYLLNKAFLI